ncbi:divergent polysaccharide deacetylase family protein [Oceanicoccus sp. KOV_DT_Chl]|uniref:divergent polysaccharide deacetylase family protein n=1 Tax=Oceanicoccus sp. KOV_DT_Chl TaxID=1904639 RepID=UPI000C7D1ED7|nr:divergent polysaccharide deacetylase family protein [Oceanicoccus sp. KOV_DT_Chl]
MMIVVIAFMASHPAASLETQPSTARIVIIIDDMGNSLELGQRAIALPGPINYAFLPYSKYAATLADHAHQQQKEILLHLPMSNLNSYATGPGTLTAAMQQQQFLLTLQQDLASIPHIRGVNNHMGSLLTQLQQPMDWLMQELKEQQLYFLDSRTTPRTVAESRAKAHNIPHLRRDVFLDNDRRGAAIAEQFSRLIKLAKLQGQAVAIGHPYPETLSFLEKALPKLQQQQVQLVHASEIVR